MRYLRSFDRFRHPVNEELLGGLLDWFKKIWDKAIKELEVMEDDPNKIKDWVINNALNPKNDNNVFSQVLKDFNKKDNPSDEDCLALIDSILNPATGSLGKQGIGVLLSNKTMQGEKLKNKRAMLEYIINMARNESIVKTKFAGGPADGKVDPKKIIVDLKDTTHLPDLKKILTAAKPEDKKKKTSDWVTATLIPMIQNFVKIIKEDDIREALKKQGLEIAAGANYKEGDSVIYLLKDKKKDDWDKLSDDQKKTPDVPPANGIVGVHKIEKIEGDTITLLDGDGKPTITKTKEDIIGKAGEKGPNAQNLAKKLGDIKTDEEKMKKVGSYVDFINNDANKDKVAEIEKIIGPEAPTK
jgi:hypothetical protein